MFPDRKKEVIIMKISIEFDFNEMVAFKEMVHVALKCAAKGGLKMKSVDDQMEEVSNLVGDGVIKKEFDSFLVVNCFDGIAAVLHRVGGWLVQTMEMAKDIMQLDKEYDKRMRAYLSKKEADKDAE